LAEAVAVSYDGSMDKPRLPELTLRAVQNAIRATFGARDSARGDAATFLWLSEEFGELATALRLGTDEELGAEMADVLAWLATLANVRGIDLEAAFQAKYGHACPACGVSPCGCDPGRKP
jgi:NTP pyrophosphatase (non-canonical NTP hydrolase)